MSAALGQASAYCAPSEFQTFFPPEGQTCGAYMQPYIEMAGGYLGDVNATRECNYCRLDNTDDFLLSINASWETRWRDFGLLWVYVGFNIGAAILLYWVCRVPKGKKGKSAST